MAVVAVVVVIVVVVVAVAAVVVAAAARGRLAARHGRIGQSRGCRSRRWGR